MWLCCCGCTAFPSFPNYDLIPKQGRAAAKSKSPARNCFSHWPRDLAGAGSAFHRPRVVTPRYVAFSLSSFGPSPPRRRRRRGRDRRDRGERREFIVSSLRFPGGKDLPTRRTRSVTAARWADILTHARSGESLMAAGSQLRCFVAHSTAQSAKMGLI